MLVFASSAPGGQSIPCLAGLAWHCLNYRKEKIMNILSLFDGMSCGRIAAERAGLRVDNYYASEIDKHAIKVSQANWPDIQHLGDVESWREWGIDWASIDLLIAGSPCQGFSFAGKQLAFEDPRSKLFFVFVDILNHIKELNHDVKFMLENVKMKKEFLDVITDRVGVEPEFINSKDYSACERPRHYWFNFEFNRTEPSPLSFGNFVDYSITENTMSDGWHEWWEKNKEFQLKKSYSRIVESHDQGITMTARQYASWNGNFIPTPEGKLRKPIKSELAKLVGAPSNYFDNTSQRQAELMCGNGWQVDTITHIFKHI